MSFDLNQISKLEIMNLISDAAEKYLTRKDAHWVTVKGDANFVTRVDTNIEHMMKRYLKIMYPDIQFMGEESDNSNLDFSKPFWILDPVDGTSNLIHDYKNSSMSLALVVDGEPVFGIIYHFYTKEFFYAYKGQGAFSTQGAFSYYEPIRVSSITELSRSLACIGTSPYDKATLGEKNMDTIKKIFFLCEDIRRSGSAAIDLANIAAGRTDIFLERNLKPWDFAAGILIIQEAGGITTDYQGNKINITQPSDILAGNPVIHQKILQELNR